MTHFFFFSPVSIAPPPPGQELLTSRSSQASSVERSMREISTLHQMFSTAVAQQAEAIEMIYDAAVEASGHLMQVGPWRRAGASCR